MTTNHELLELVQDLARILSLEYADVDDEDLDSIQEGIEALTKAKTQIEASGAEPPEELQMIIERYAKNRPPPQN